MHIPPYRNGTGELALSDDFGMGTNLALMAGTENKCNVAKVTTCEQHTPKKYRNLSGSTDPTTVVPIRNIKRLTQCATMVWEVLIMSSSRT